MEKTVLYLLLLIGAANSLSDIATLRKENEILCITGDVTLPTFISPPCIENSTKSLSLLTGEDWSYDNWILTDGSKSLSGSVTDKRWESKYFLLFVIIHKIQVFQHLPFLRLRGF
jgi:hypothetical protein